MSNQTSTPTEITFEYCAPDYFLFFAAHPDATEADFNRARAEFARTCKEHYAAGRVGVARREGGVALYYRSQSRHLRGSSVADCDYRDGFVQEKAQQFREEIGANG